MPKRPKLGAPPLMIYQNLECMGLIAIEIFLLKNIRK